MEFEAFQRRLSQINPRSAHLLTIRILGRIERTRVAKAFGVSLEAFNVLFFRSAQEFAGLEPIDDQALEQKCARELAQWLEAGQVPETSTAFKKS
jgi:hypothetical protein